jgi:hypothetical protein
MSASPLYESIYARLQQSLPDSLSRQNENLAATVAQVRHAGCGNMTTDKGNS